MNTYTKTNVSIYEYIVHKYVYDLNIVNIPKIINYCPKEKILTMEKIDFMNIADFYGENTKDKRIFNEIRKIIKKLYEHDICYPDITGYNFIEKDGKMWIIDFEHVFFKDKEISRCDKDNLSFIKDFIDGCDEWNPYFA